MKSRSWYFFLAFICLSVLVPSHILASHVMGADMSYQYLGNNRYEIKVTIYRDCNGIHPSGGGIAMYLEDGTWVNLGGSLGNGVDITPTSPGQCNRCIDAGCSLKFGIQRFEVTSTVDLSSYSDCKFKFTWGQCCRNAAATTGSANANIFLDCELERCKAGDHNSPQFAFDPLAYIPVKQCTHLMQNVKCSSKDSIIYSLYAPLINRNTSISYISGYSYNKPIKTDTTKSCTFNFDTLTGRVEINPDKTDITTMGIKVEQWRKDSTGTYQNVGFIRRDMQISVLSPSNPTNTAPYFSTVQIKNSNVYYGCVGDSVKLEIHAMDDNSADTVTMAWELQDCYDTTAHFQLKGTAKRPIGVFSWKADPARIVSNEPYKVLVSLRDNAPLNHITQELFYVYIRDTFPPFTYKKEKDTVCGRNILYVDYDTALNFKFAWYMGDSLVSANDTFVNTVSANGAQPVELIVTAPQGCTQVIRDTIISDHYPVVDAGNDTVICKGGGKQLHASGAYSYRWFPSKGLSDTTIADPIASPDTTTTYYVIGYSEYGCPSVVDSMTLEVINMEKIVITRKPYASSYCNTGPSNWRILGLNEYPKGAVYSLYANNVLYISHDAHGFAHENLDSSTWFKMVVEYKGCLVSDSFYVYIHEKSDSFKLQKCPDQQICLGDSVQLWVSGGKYYEWKAAPGITDLASPTPYVKPQADQDYIVTIYDTLHCNSITDTVHVKVNKITPGISANKLKVCEGDTVTLHATGGNKYIWSPAGLFQDARVADPVALVPKDTTYTVVIEDTLTGCIGWDTISVTIDTTCVWPGDANNDGKADYLDILQIALSTNTFGTSRPNASDKWRGEPAALWNQQTGGIDLKYSDANGSGKIEDNDTMVVIKNYNLVHLKNDGIAEGNMADPPMYFEFDQDTFFGGDKVTATVYIGTEQVPVNGIYGMGMKYSYGNQWIEANSYKFSYVCKLLCSSSGSFTFYRPSMDFSSADVVITRRDGINRTGYADIGKIEFTLKDSTAGYSENGEWITLQFNKLKAVDKDGNEVALNPISDSAIVFSSRSALPSGISPAAWERSVKLYPNPAQDMLVVESGNVDLLEIALINTVGQELIRIAPGQKSDQIVNISPLPEGVYLVRLRSVQGDITYKKLLIQR